MRSDEQSFPPYSLPKLYAIQSTVTIFHDVRTISKYWQTVNTLKTMKYILNNCTNWYKGLQKFGKENLLVRPHLKPHLEKMCLWELVLVTNFYIIRRNKERIWWYLMIIKWLFCLFLHKNLCCGCSLESPRRGDSNEHPQHWFLWRFDKNYVSIIIKYAPYFFCCVWPTLFLLNVLTALKWTHFYMFIISGWQT